MSIEAVARALRVDVGDATRKLVLIGYADHAHRDGTCAYASIKTISELANCAPRTVQRHLKWLLENGYMRVGDQSLIDPNIRTDRRPTLYDVALSDEQRDDWIRGDNVSPRPGCDGVTDPASRGDNLTPDGVTDEAPRGDTAVSPEPKDKPTDKPNPEPSSSAEPPTPLRPEVDDLCEHLAAWIERNGSKRPTITKKWRDACRLMIDTDGREPDKIRKAIDWCQRDEFWRGNILSMPTLRKQYDKLRLAAQRGGRPSNNLTPTDAEAERLTAAWK